ncbi:MAG: trypsin-like serine protease [Myxococcales bacterium]|nr:trypsin-like serine protease [Myxococcales bacterium]
MARGAANNITRHKQHSALVATCLSSLIATAACVEQPPATEASQAAIIGGLSAKIGDYPAVVAIFDQGDRTICTGTLIAPDAVLTAAHCVSHVDDAARQRLIADTVVYLDTLSMFDPVTTIKVADITIHPNYMALAQDPEQNGYHDVAIIRLAQPITDRRVAHVSRQGVGAIGAADFTLVGYGIYDEASGNTGRLHATQDASIDCAPHGTPNDRFICFDRADGTGACAGDSGSPLYEASEAGVLAVVGVHSWGSSGGTCIGIGADTKLAAELPFISETLGEAFLCAADGVCDDVCGDKDIDCTAGPNAACAADNQCGEGYACDAAACQPIANLLIGGPGDDEAQAAGCRASSTPGATNTSGLIIMALACIAIGRRRRYAARQAA